MGPTGETTATTSTLSITWNRTTIQTSYVKYHHELPYWYGCQNAVNGSQPLPPSMFQTSLLKLFSFLAPAPCVHSFLLVARARPSCRHAVDFSVIGQTIWTGTIYTVVVSLSISLSENGAGLDVLSIRVILQVQQGLHLQTLLVGEIIVDSIRLVMALHLHLLPRLHNHHFHNTHGISLERTRHHTAITTA